MPGDEAREGQFYWTLLQKTARRATHNNTRVYRIFSAVVKGLLLGIGPELRDFLTIGG